MDVTATPDNVQIELQTKPGAELRTEDVRKCLDVTMERLNTTKSRGTGAIR